MSDTTVKVKGISTAIEVRTQAEVPQSISLADRTIRFDGLNYSATLNGSSVPAIGQPPIAEAVTIGASAHVIDLTAAVLARDSSETIDLTGAKLVGFSIEARSTNTGDVTFGPGATNGYALFGGTNELILNPGDHLSGFTVAVASGKPAVAAVGAKFLELAGTLGDLVDYILFFDDS